MFSRPKILFLVSLLFVALLNPKFNPYLLFKFLIFYHSSTNATLVHSTYIPRGAASRTQWTNSTTAVQLDSIHPILLDNSFSANERYIAFFVIRLFSLNSHMYKHTAVNYIPYSIYIYIYIYVIKSTAIRAQYSRMQLHFTQ